MDMTQKIILFRWVVFILALGFWNQQFLLADLSKFGIQFRFLTIWTLTFNVIVAFQMLKTSQGNTTARWDGFVGLVVVMNVAVVVQYWRLYFIDPALVQSNGGLPWYREYYLHALGPMLVWIDAFLIHGAFKKIKTTFIWVIAIGLLYPIWLELLVQPRNTLPVGTETNGLPYPFLNDLTFSGRSVFYAISTIANIVFLVIGIGIARLLNTRKGV